MADVMRVPEVAAGATEVIVAEWLVETGSSFSMGEAIAVIETEKAVVEVEAEIDGVILRTLVDGGSTVEVGSPMAILGGAGETSVDVDAFMADLGLGAVESTPAAERREVPETEEHEHESPAPVVGSARLFVSPLARKMLREAGVEPSTVQGTGPGGRIVRRDVEAVLRGEPAVVAPATPPTPPTPVTPATPATVGVEHVDTPHSRMRRAIASRLTQSKQEIPHFYLTRTVSIDALLALRAQINVEAPVRISVNDFVVRAVGVAHARVPEANVIWTEDAMRSFTSVDVSVAIASDRGLVTPVVRGVDTSTLTSISTRVKEYVELAGQGRLQQKDLEGGTISVTNLGMYGVDEFAAIINPPHSAILAVGAGRPGPVVVDGQLQVATCMRLVLSVDHRAIDGALAARWMDVLVRVLENPISLLV